MINTHFSQIPSNHVILQHRVISRWYLACRETEKIIASGIWSKLPVILRSTQLTKRKRKRRKEKQRKTWRQLAEVNWRVMHTRELILRAAFLAFSFAAVLSLATSAWRGQCVKITRSAVDIDLSLSPRSSHRFLASLREARSKCRSQSSGRFVCR